MKKNRVKKIIMLIVIFAMLVFLSEKAFGLITIINNGLHGEFKSSNMSDESSLKIKIIIDNYDEYRNQCSNIQIKQSVFRIKNVYMTSTRYRINDNPWYVNGTINEEKLPLDRYGRTVVGPSFSLKHNETIEINYKNKTDSIDAFDIRTMIPMQRGGSYPYWAEYQQNRFDYATDLHLSLKNIEYVKNAQAFTLENIDKRTAANLNIIPKTSFKVVEKNKNSEIIIHYTYHPDLKKIPYSPPKIASSKQIDYLGDKDVNDDTKLEGKRDYRQYISIETEKDEAQESADFIFVIDASGSMKGGRARALENTLKKTTDIILSNSKNTISMVSFSYDKKRLITRSSNKYHIYDKIDDLISYINSNGGGTCFYEGLQEGRKILDELNSVDYGKNKNVVFISDGAPNSAVGIHDSEGYAALVYAYDEVSKMNNLDRFYSIYVGDRDYGASVLQFITQFANTKKENEKIMILAEKPEDIGIAMNDFMKRLGNPIKNIEVTDIFSQYANISIEPDVKAKIYADNKVLLLKEGIDFKYEIINRKIKFTLLNKSSAGAKYEFSYNIYASDLAFDEYCQSLIYPNVGESDTDYHINKTSSNKEGFYPQLRTVLKYEFGRNQKAEVLMEKPVIQVIAPDRINISLEAKKVLLGRKLKDKEFDFAIEDGNGRRIQESKNNESGKIIFSDIYRNRTGMENYYIYELLPLVTDPDIIYDSKRIMIMVDYKLDNGKIKANIHYPNNIIFENRYKYEAKKIGIEVDVILKGMKLAAGKFSFDLIEDGASDVTSTNNSDGKVCFEKEINNPGKYTYKIKQNIPKKPEKHMIYDERTITIVADVKADDTGKLLVSFSYEPEDKFVNTYQTVTEMQ